MLHPIGALMAEIYTGLANMSFQTKDVMYRKTWVLDQLLSGWLYTNATHNITNIAQASTEEHRFTQYQLEHYRDNVYIIRLYLNVTGDDFTQILQHLQERKFTYQELKAIMDISISASAEIAQVVEKIKTLLREWASEYLKKMLLYGMLVPLTGRKRLFETENPNFSLDTKDFMSMIPTPLGS